VTKLVDRNKTVSDAVWPYRCVNGNSSLAV